MADIPLDRIEVCKDRRRRTIGIDFFINGIDACGHTARAMRTVIIPFKLIQAIHERPGLHRAVGILFHCAEFILHGLGRCRECKPRLCNEKDKCHEDGKNLLPHVFCLHSLYVRYHSVHYTISAPPLKEGIELRPPFQSAAFLRFVEL